MSRTYRNVLFVIIVLLVIAVAVLAWFLLKPIIFKPAEMATSTPSVTTATTTTPAVATTTPAGPADLTSSNQYYTADMEYPSSTPLAQSAGAQADAAAVQTMKSAMQSDIDAFVQQGTFDNPPAGEIASMQGQQATISSTYQLYTSPGTISYVFTITENTLGAHPNSSYQTFTFDMVPGEQISLSDLFNAGSNYLAGLSNETRAILTTQLGSSADPSFIDPGTTAEDSNFENFALDGTNLDIFFAPYTVAPYSSGPQIVKIPTAALSTILQAQYQ